MNQRIVPSISFAVLTIASLFGLVKFHQEKELHEEVDFELEFPYGMFIIPVFYGILGALIYIGNLASYRLWTALYKSEICLSTIAFPLFATEIWLKYHIFQPEVAWIHAVVGVIPAIMFLYDNHFKDRWIDLAVYLNTLSLVIVNFQYQNYWGLLSAVTFATGYYIQRKSAYIMHIEPLVSFNFLVAAYCLFALFAIKGEPNGNLVQPKVGKHGD